MSQLSGTSFENLYGTSGTTFADNTSGDISEGDVRTFGQDIKDSFLNKSDSGINVATFKPIHQVTLSLSSAQILALNATPIQLVAAPGANKILMIHNAYAVYTFVSAAYSTQTSVNIRYNGGSIARVFTNILANTSTFHSTGTNIGISTTTDNSNKALNVDVSTGDPTAGDSTLKIYVEYTTLSL